jgi:hypothetical protein
LIAKAFNIDKTGVSTVQTPNKVLEKGGMKHVGQKSSAERDRCNCYGYNIKIF